jgi:hypothetical protein
MAFKIIQQMGKTFEKWHDSLPVVGGMVQFSGPAVEAWDAAAPGAIHRPRRNKNKSKQQKAARARNRA